MTERKLKYIQLNNGTELIGSVDFVDWDKKNYIEIYDPFRLYPIPPFLTPDNSSGQTMLLIKWLPWTDDLYVSILLDKILVATDVSAHMEDYYNSTVQKHDESAAEEEFRKAGESTISMPNISDISEITDLEDEILSSAPESLEELAEALNELVKNTKKKVMH